MNHYNVAIIGAGPAGLFAAHYILKHSTPASVILIDMGKAVQDRTCCGSCHSCADSARCGILCGVGGSGLFSDGKLILDLHSGGKLDAITSLSEQKRAQLKQEIVETLKRHDGKSEPGPNPSEQEREAWRERFASQGLHIKHYDVLHMGTANLHHITKGFAAELCENPRLTLKLGCEVVELENAPQGRSILHTNGGASFSAEHVVFAVGKTGSRWLNKLFREHKIGFCREKTYIGVRLETSHAAIQELFAYSFDPKIWAYYQNRKVKTHCFCRHGDIVCTNYMGFPIVGGHTRFTKKNDTSFCQPSQKGNFNVLVSTERSDSDLLRLLSRFREIHPDGVVVQSLLRFLHPETPETEACAGAARSKAGNIRKILDGLDATGAIISDFIQRLGKIAPGILGEDSLVYAPALEWFMDRIEVDPNMETSHRGWFAVGDGAGLSQGIVHSAATSIIAAEEICRRITT